MTSDREQQIRERAEELRDIIYAGHVSHGAVRLKEDDHHFLCGTRKGNACDCYAEPHLPARAAFAELLSELAAARGRAEQVEKALDALRWTRNDGSYVNGCWCDVKVTDYGPDWHTPRCRAARAALAEGASGDA